MIMVKHYLYVNSYFTLGMLGFCILLLTSADFFHKHMLSGIQSECQTVWMKIRSDVRLSLILVETICKVYQQRMFIRDRRQSKTLIQSTNVDQKELNKELTYVAT